MSVNHAPLPQSLPSFAQAFSSSSLNEIPSSSNALPPIQSQSYERTRQTASPPLPSPQPTLHPSRKRSREEPARAESSSDSGRQSPRVLRIKEEEDRDPSLVSSPSPTRDASPTTNPPSSKKRRVTVSGIHLSHQPDPSTSPAFSDKPPSTPVVIAIPSSDESSIRSIQTLKQQQKQRRGSLAQSAGPSTMLSPPINGSTPCSATFSPPDGTLAASKSLPRLGRRSPNTASGSNRCGGNTAVRVTLTPSTSRPLTPPPIIVPSQQPVTLTTNQASTDVPPTAQQGLPPHSLPPPPISFARRRAAQSGGRKKKPADILISPRGPNSSDSLAPVIQSAPPVPEFGRFPMALPRLPTALSGNQTTRRVATNVPPTPTRFSLQHTIGSSVSSAPRAGPSTRSPPAVPIASSLVPPTPSSLQHPGYTGDKTAFLAPFEMFYDALNDSKQMKNWLAEQLQKSNTLLQSLQRIDQVVEDIVDRRTRTMQEEMQSMRQRMDSLEEAFRTVRADSARNQSMSGVGYPPGSKFSQNGIPPGSEPSSSYRFPTTEQRRRVSPPSWGADKECGTSPSPDTDRRMSISIARVDAPRLLPGDAQPQGSYSPFGPGSRGGPISASNPKGTPPSRSQVVPERPSAHRQADSRQTNRMFYPGSYNGGSGDVGPTSRGNDSHKNPGAMEER